jgi:hypothetical protein
MGAVPNLAPTVGQEPARLRLNPILACAGLPQGLYPEELKASV